MCSGTTPATGKCDKCGAIYKRGALIEKGAPRKVIPIKHRSAKPPEAVNLDTLPWSHYETAPDRDAAIEAMHNFYDARPGRRRTPSREAFEVVSAVLAPGHTSFWEIHVRRVTRREAVAEKAQETVAKKVVVKEPAAVPEPTGSPYEGKRGRHPVVCGCSKHSEGGEK